jgi:hypothetical protein
MGQLSLQVLHFLLIEPEKPAKKGATFGVFEQIGFPLE